MVKRHKFLVVHAGNNSRDLGLVNIVFECNDIDLDTQCIIDPVRYSQGGASRFNGGNEYTGLILLGCEDGYPCNRADKMYYPNETSWISIAKEANIPVLGICQGAQLIASVVGGHNTLKTLPHSHSGPSELKIADNIDFKLGDILRSKRFHQNHKDYFDISDHSIVPIAYSTGCNRQHCEAFHYKDLLYAYQFHIDFPEDWLNRFSSGYSPSEAKAVSEANCDLLIHWRTKAINNKLRTIA